MLAALMSFPAAARDASAQVIASERGGVTQTISGTEIEIDYGRPSWRGRDSIFGTDIPWEDFWTPGANESTTLRVTSDFTLEGHELEAGKYGLWLQVMPDENWTLMLHHDTTLYHWPHLKADDGFLSIPVKREIVGDFKETLTFDLQRVRADGADVQMHWGDTRVAFHLGVDPGFATTVTPEVAAGYVGSWTVTRQHSMSDSAVAAMRERMSEEEWANFEAYFAPKPYEVRHDAETGYLLVYAVDDETPDVPEIQLLPRAEGIFGVGQLMNGELAFADQNDYWEFDMPDDGPPPSFTWRGANDRVTGTGVREGGGDLTERK